MFGRLFSTGVIALMIGTIAEVKAQESDFTIDNVTTETAIAPGSFFDFKVYVTNNTQQTATLKVHRTRAEVPSDAWFSTVCTPLFCYGPDVDETDPFEVKAGEKAEVKLTVFPSQTPNESAEFELSILEGDFFPRVVGTVSFTAVVDDGSSVDQEVHSAPVAYPNPASSWLTIPVETAASVPVEIVDAVGRSVTALSTVRSSGSEVTVDIRHLAPGPYLYRTADGSVSGTFTVVR